MHRFGLRRLHSALPLLNVSGKAQKHLEFLQKYYTPELLQLIKITESLVDPAQYLKIQTHKKALSRVGPAPGDDLHMRDAKWEEPVLYPNQGVDLTPYPPIPQISAPDRPDLKLRFGEVRGRLDRKGKTSPERGRVSQMDQDLAKLTGMSVEYISNLRVRAIVRKRVSCQTKQGKVASFYSLTVVGDGKGMVGIGEGKSRDSMKVSCDKLRWNAVKNMRKIAMFEKRTIAGDIDHKFHSVRLFLKLAPPGFGLRVNHNLFEVCQAAGIKDLRAKVYRLRNSMNVIKAFMEALTTQQPLEALAAGRGKKVVSLRQVYYSS